MQNWEVKTACQAPQNGFPRPSEGKTVQMKRGVGTVSSSIFGGVDMSVGRCSVGCWENETTNASTAKVNV